MPVTRRHRDTHVRAEQRRFRRARDGEVWQAPELPRFYYLEHFERFLAEVRAAHTSLLGTDELAFLDGFAALPFNARCAFVRVANRRGYVFDLDKLDYPEIDDPADAWAALARTGFTEPVPRALHPDWLDRLTRPELVGLLVATVCPTRFRKSWKKAELVRVALEETRPDGLHVPERFVAQGRRDALNYLLYLYFGRVDDNLQAFTLADLGLAERIDASEEPAHRFEASGDAKAAFFYARAVHDLRHGTDADATRLVAARRDWPVPPCGECEAQRDRLIHELGLRAERCGDLGGALSLYADSAAPACNERTVRIRHRRDEGDDRAWVRTRLEAMIDDPASDEELVFAEDFHARKYGGRRTSAATDLVRSAVTVTVDEAWRGRPERAALGHYEARGIPAYRTENALWRTLFAVLFRDELFDDGASGGRTPAALRAGTFLADHLEAIEAKLAALDEPHSALALLLESLSAQDDEDEPEDDPISQWREGLPEALGALLLHAPTGAVAHVLRLMAGDWRGTRDGFPDLMLVEDGRTRFVEIKTDGDALRRNQMARMLQLRAAGFDVELVRVDYGVDPDQTYVVVDVETTGRRPGLHRITEIGAVKVRGDEVLGEFQTLVNPGRPIPGNISRLTGITDAMVAPAPTFADVADRFEDFVGDAVFVAHNVNFDYGFVSAEFEMIDRTFRRPKLCTCASMRKHRPGHDSYSLKRLCADFGIELETHHRALCDAKAAARLLSLINAARSDARPEPADPVSS